MTDVSAARLEGTWARHAVAHAEVLIASDPSWGTRWFPLADGYVVLQGAGLYVNRALAVGLRESVAPADLVDLEDAASEMGLPAAIDLGPQTFDDLRSQLHAVGYAPSGETRVMTMVCEHTALVATDSAITVREVASDELPLWQRACRDGWGHDTPQRQRASDAYAAAAQRTPGERLLLAFDALDGRPIGCASLAVRDGLATLGGMSTLPTERRRGVQRALVAERLRLAHEAGCDVAATSAVAGGPSERNLLRLGFEHRYTKSSWVRQPVDA
jgi:GNAT superfamily N-acetyltransferase